MSVSHVSQSEPALTAVLRAHEPGTILHQFSRCSPWAMVSSGLGETLGLAQPLKALPLPDCAHPLGPHLMVELIQLRA